MADNPATDSELDPRILIAAYSQGLFPMAHPRTGQIGWYSADPRAVLPLDGLRISRSLRNSIRQSVLGLRCDTAFAEVIGACAAPRRSDDDETWISPPIVQAYCQLHRLGWAHSLEAYLEGRLVGGLYGVAVGAAFFGESMFVRPDQGGTDASKVCLVALVQHLRRRGYVLLDAQYPNPHLERLGFIEIRRAKYLQRLKRAMKLTSVSWGRFRFDAELALNEAPDAVDPGVDES